MTHQRRRYGTTVTCYPAVKTIDLENAEVLIPDMDNPLPPVRGTLGPERAQRAEVPGQVEVNILELRLEYRPDLEGINSWWRLEFDDKAWDVVGPPTIRKFTVRQTRHIALHVRERGVGIG